MGDGRNGRRDRTIDNSHFGFLVICHALSRGIFDGEVPQPINCGWMFNRVNQ